MAPGIDGSLFQGVVIRIGAIAPEVTLQVMPQVFNRIEFGTVRRQRHQGNVGRNLQAPAGVKASLVPNHDRVFACGDRLGELLQE